MEYENFSTEFAFEAKSFIESCCKNVIKNVEVYYQKENLRQVSERLFYSQFFDKIQLKFLVYKLNELKLKSIAEANYYKQTEQADADKRKIWEDSKKFTQGFLNTLFRKTINEYNKYTVKVLFSVVVLQRRFRGHLFRFIHKMELMNHKIEKETQRAEERTRRKTIMIKEERKRKSIMLNK